MLTDTPWRDTPSRFDLNTAARLLERTLSSDIDELRRRVFIGACHALTDRLCRRISRDLERIRAEKRALERELMHLTARGEKKWSSLLVSLIDRREAEMNELSHISSEATFILLRLPRSGSNTRTSMAA